MNDPLCSAHDHLVRADTKEDLLLICVTFCRVNTNQNEAKIIILTSFYEAVLNSSLNLIDVSCFPRKCLGLQLFLPGPVVESNLVEFEERAAEFNRN